MFPGSEYQILLKAVGIDTQTRAEWTFLFKAVLHKMQPMWAWMLHERVVTCVSKCNHGKWKQSHPSVETIKTVAYSLLI